MFTLKIAPKNFKIISTKGVVTIGLGRNRTYNHAHYTLSIDLYWNFSDHRIEQHSWSKGGMLPLHHIPSSGMSGWNWTIISCTLLRQAHAPPFEHSEHFCVDWCLLHTRLFAYTAEKFWEMLRKFLVLLNQYKIAVTYRNNHHRIHRYLLLSLVSITIQNKWSCSLVFGMFLRK